MPISPTNKRNGTALRARAETGNPACRLEGMEAHLYNAISRVDHGFVARSSTIWANGRSDLSGRPASGYAVGTKIASKNDEGLIR